MRLRCPNCQVALEIVEESSTFNLSCPTCGEHVEKLILGDETVPLNIRQGERIAQFELVQFLGQGAFGSVWKAHDTELDRFVALKLPRADEFDERTVQQFCREARAASQVKHPNIVSVYEIGRESNTLYIASELIDGVSLKDRLASRQFSVSESAQLVATLADGLQVAHEAGVVHRDLKPGNVLLDGQDQPHLTDFGLAKRESTEITVTAEGQVLGTVAYMSPEQARGDSRNADRRSDVYSLGVILYELLTGQKPFSSGKSRLILHQVQHDDPVPPRKVNRRIPRDMETICLKAMQKVPAKRYASAAEMASDLRRVLRGEPIRARSVTRAERGWRWCRRNPAASTAAILGMGMIAMLPAFFTPQDTPTQPPLAAVPPANLRAVRILTDPPDARIVLHPLDPQTGVPQPENAIRPPGTTPLETNLEPGDYLVVAVSNAPDYSFHEVFRRVPAANSLAGAYRHQTSKVADDGVIELPKIDIPEANVTAGMTAFPGDPRFTMGDAAQPAIPPHQRSIPPFLLDPDEITVGEFRAELGEPIEFMRYEEQGAELRDEDALGFIDWDQATAFAEVKGKRLPDEWEYEFAATNEGMTQFPWGDDGARITSWELGPPGNAEWDVLETDPPVRGLFSNVSEWTASWPLLYPAHRQIKPLPPSEAPSHRIVRGGLGYIMGSESTPRGRVAQSSKTWNRNLGFRGARSQKPRLQPEDFSREVED